MKKRFREIVALLTAFCCVAGISSCGREIPANTDPEPSGFVIAGGDADDSEDDADKPVLIPRTTTSAEIQERETGTTATGNNVSVVTRSKDEIDRINGNKKPVTAKPSGGAVRPVGGNNNSSVTVTVAGNGTGTGNSQTTTQASTAPSINLSYTSAEIIVGETKGYPNVSQSITEIWTTSDAKVATVDQYGNITGTGEGTCKIRVTDANNSNSYGEVTVTVKKLNTEGIQEIDGVTYADGILIANKSYSLPKTYNPGGLTNDTYSAFTSLAQGASVDGLNIYVSSGFRSYESQEQIYNNYVWTHGQATADTFSARPGHSEHQTGLAIDVNIIDDSFAGTPEAVWLEEHCYDYGFIIRYPKGKQDITGYKYEPWHIRYVGKDMAKKIKDKATESGDPYLSLEEYFGITSKYE